jgi:hypothetical protein
VIDLLQTSSFVQILLIFPKKHTPHDVQAKAIKAYGMEGFIEIVALSGFYQMFSAIKHGFDIASKNDTIVQ